MRQTFFTHDWLFIFSFPIHFDTILRGFLFHSSGELWAAAVSVIMVFTRPALIQRIRFRCSLVSGFHRNLPNVRTMFLPLLRFTSHQAHHLRRTFPTHIASPPAAGVVYKPSMNVLRVCKQTHRPPAVSSLFGNYVSSRAANLPLPATYHKMFRTQAPKL